MLQAMTISRESQNPVNWLAEAKERLEQWGAEERRQRRIGGYADETFEYVSMRYGGRAPVATGQRPEKEAPDIIAIDNMITEMRHMGVEGEKRAAALYVYYVFRKSYGQGCRMLHCSRSYFQRLVEGGQDVVAGGLMSGKSA